MFFLCTAAALPSYFAGEVLEGHLYVVTGYAPGGSVADWLADAGPLAEAPTQRVVRSVLEGLGYLHSHDVAHGAVRGGNVLLGPGAAIRLCDFGLSALREGSVAGSVPKGRANESSVGEHRVELLDLGGFVAIRRAMDGP
eukprot:Skav210600  [mRNA]  locus=scaffold234:3568:8962:+ [translate_table: standard]